MPEIGSNIVPVCCLNGEYIPFSEARLPVYDLSIMQGATVTERLRTFRHQPDKLDEHLDRLENSLKLVGWEAVADRRALAEQVQQVVQQNTQLIASTDDLSVVLFVTAGQSVGDANGLITASRPTVCVYTARLPWARWANDYQHGVQLVIPPVTQLPASCVDPHVKMRSRLHWQIADSMARESVPGAAALLLDQEGFLTETSSGNLIIVRDGELYTPKAEKTLGGISRRQVEILSEMLGIRFSFSDLTEEELLAADEAFLTSSTYSLVPVAALNGNVIGDERPGPVTRQLTELWCQQVGLNFAQQAIDQSRSAM